MRSIFAVRFGIVVCLLGGAGVSVAAAGRVARFRVGKVTAYTRPGERAFFFTSKMAIDADGAPRAYHPDNRSGLDDLKNAGRPGNWWALVTDGHGKPVVQGPTDPAPGFYISTTSLEDPAHAEADPRRYVDATRIPYFVLPKEGERQGGARLGDYGVVLNRKNGRLSSALFADQGPAGKIGEGSIALARAMEIDADARRGGQNSGVVYLVFPGSGEGKPQSPERIAAEGKRLLEAWGGQEALLRLAN